MSADRKIALLCFLPGQVKRKAFDVATVNDGPRCTQETFHSSQGIIDSFHAKVFQRDLDSGRAHKLSGGLL